MSEEKTLRLIKVAKELNVGLQHVVEFLETKGVVVDSSPNTKISMEVYGMLQEKYAPDKLVKLDAQEITREKLKRDTVTIATKTAHDEARVDEVEPDNDESLKASLEAIKQSASKTAKKTTKTKKGDEKIAEPEPEVIKAKTASEGPKILGKIDLDAGAKKKTAKKKEEAEAIAKEDAKKKSAKKKEEDVEEEYDDDDYDGDDD